ncbi:YceI family protein [Pseudaestuariivita rosea]|uniref:YceI family protein n=1 Tax=Pseudaestuariivita rosea TaxID=2763263 RepID=UPI001ABBB1E1|nr:YceI family protein [Pseudaestuariivita rosea]
MKPLAFATAIAVLATPVFAAPERYALDASHSQVLFSYNHLGYSTTFGMFSGFEGEIMFDQEDPANSSVTVSMPVMSMFTGWEAREEHFMSDDFFGATEDDMITFSSTSIEVTGDNTANITGDLTMNDITQSVVLETTLTQSQPFPFGPKEGTPTVGFDATTTLLRSDFGVGAFAPAVSDEVEVRISIEAQQAE